MWMLRTDGWRRMVDLAISKNHYQPIVVKYSIRVLYMLNPEHHPRMKKLYTGNTNQIKVSHFQCGKTLTKLRMRRRALLSQGDDGAL